VVLAAPAVEDEALSEGLTMSRRFGEIKPLKTRGGRRLPREGLSRILVRGTNWIGDAVMTLPALAWIRETYPRARITILAKPWVAAVYRLSPHVDDVLIFERPGRHEGSAGLFRLAGALRKEGFDAAILLQNAIEAAIIASLAGIPIRAGYNTDGRGILLTHAVVVNREVRRIHQTRYYLEMVRALGCRGAETRPRLKLTGEMEEIGERVWRRYNLEGRPLAGMAPGAAYGPAKRWPAARFSALADMLTETLAARVVLFGSAADGEVTGEVTAKARHDLLNLAGKTNLEEAVALIARCRLFVSNDSGLMHVSAALGVPTVAVFGSTNPVTTAPLGEKVRIVRKDIPCSPCLKKRCRGDFACMNLIGPEEVFAAAQAAWEA